MSVRDPGLGPLGNEGGDMLVKFTVADYIDRVMRVATEHMESVMREVREGFERIDRKLDGKADKADVEDLKGRVRVIEGRYEPLFFDRVLKEHNQVVKDVAELNTTSVTKKALEDRDRTLLAAVWSLAGTIVAGIIVALIVWLLNNHPHL